LERSALGIDPLPSSLAEAIRVMERSELVAETLGEHVFEFFLRNKRAEWDDYRRQVSSYERDRMLPVL
jgi:glutamine synthetase